MATGMKWIRWGGRGGGGGRTVIYNVSLCRSDRWETLRHQRWRKALSREKDKHEQDSTVRTQPLRTVFSSQPWVRPFVQIQSLAGNSVTFIRFGSRYADKRRGERRICTNENKNVGQISSPDLSTPNPIIWPCAPTHRGTKMATFITLPHVGIVC